MPHFFRLYCPVFMGLFWSTLLFAAPLTPLATPRPEWQAIFDRFDARGTLVILDTRKAPPALWVLNPERAEKRYAPASTFKIPHTLFALDAGIVRDEFQVFVWDGVHRRFPLHNQDQRLRDAMRNSAVWVYDQFAKALGETRAKHYLQTIHYGNEDPSTAKGSYWIDGALAISPYEQIEFLSQLYENTLPFSREHQRLLKDIIIVEAGRDWILRAKTGWDGKHAWWVGWVERAEGAIFFALHIDTPNRLEDLFKREAITRTILESIQALPPRP